MQPASFALWSERLAKPAWRTAALLFWQHQCCIGLYVTRTLSKVIGQHYSVRCDSQHTAATCQHKQQPKQHPTQPRRFSDSSSESTVISARCLTKPLSAVNHIQVATVAWRLDGHDTSAIKAATAAWTLHAPCLQQLTSGNKAEPADSCIPAFLF